ncbi:MAG: type VI secretion system baseplate subunit TssF [Rouxiella aceris]|uniref:type VI secretion system baseplate subunit TssF n=1 Tax=Rouxiella aceris TaxID=2703884 RepID=UPI0028406D55|nr:type VI secretion system baseplate subunit TssF [Rouxiella aceris]MDR3434562.1 type VI secretion system baseplate subunit TssF [Rouxiella aceris]
MKSERFLDIYNNELAYLRESGRAFAEEHPQIAQHLGMHGEGGQDPFVERLLEGTAFLSARVQQRIENEYPEFALQMLSRLAPFWHTPVPSMATIAVTPDLTSPRWQHQVSIAKGSKVVLTDPSLKNRSVVMVTGRELKILPLILASAECVSTPSACLPEKVRHQLSAGSAFIRLGFSTQGVMPLASLDCEPLHLTLAGDHVRANQLLTLLLHHCQQVVLWSQQHPFPLVEVLEGRQCLSLSGVNEHEALLPVAIAELPGSRLLREYFVAPERFYGVEVQHIGRFLAGCKQAGDFEMIFSLDTVPLTLLQRLTVQDFRLFATPVINLYAKRCDPVALDPDASEQQIIVDRLNPTRYEIHHLTRVQGIREDGEDVSFTSLPEMAAVDRAAAEAAYSLQRKAVNRGKKGKGSALGDHEVFITLAERGNDLGGSPLQTLSADAVVIDRNFSPQDLSRPVLKFEHSFPVTGVELLRQPTRPRPLPDMEQSWQAIQALSINPLNSNKANTRDCSALLRNWLSLFAQHSDASQRKRVDSITAATMQQCFEVQHAAGPMCWTRGTVAEINIDPRHHADQGSFLFSKILHYALSEYCQLNQTLRIKLNIDNEFFAEWGPIDRG